MNGMKTKLLVVLIPCPSGKSNQYAPQEDHRAGSETVCRDPPSAFESFPGGKRRGGEDEEEEKADDADSPQALRKGTFHRCLQRCLVNIPYVR